MRILFAFAALFAVAACTDKKTQSEPQNEEVGASLSDKKDVAIADVPVEVMAAARERRADINYTGAEYEAKNGTEYYEVAGVDANGVEVELDIVREETGWRVVEIQRDITLDEMPAPARDALLAKAPDIKPARIIESDQGDGVIIYEVYTRDADGKEAKIEVKFDGATAEVLAEEWAH
jgi:hypothetical protein